MKITITLPLPPRALHPNARKHWRAKLKPKADAKAWAFLAARGAGPAQWSMAEVQATWYLARHNDGDNLIAWAKQYYDGFAAAGIIKTIRDSSIFHRIKSSASKPVESGKSCLLFNSERRVDFISLPPQEARHARARNRNRYR